MQVLYHLRRPLRALSVVLLVLLALALLVAGVRALAGWREGAVLGAAGLLLAFLAARGRRWVPRRTLLEVDLERGVVELPPPRSPLAWGRPGPYRLHDLVDALERAAGDRRVVGLVARVGAFRPGLAVAQELRDAVLAFRAAGKRAVAFAETLGEGRSTSAEYYLATAFDEILLQPSGVVGLDGLIVRHPFAKGALAKVGVEAQLGARREYKTARNLFTESAFTEAHRASLQAVLDDVGAQLVGGIAAGRRLAPETVRALLDRGPFTARQALSAGLVDGLAWRDELYERLEERGRVQRLWVERYLARARRPHRRGALVAVVYATGHVHRGPGETRRPSIGSDDVAAALRRAARSRRVRAVLLRVDSPGGSAVASETIWREVARVQAKEKPVVVSMGNVAASGGYYVACGARRIVAQPATLTGSIGVVWGKFVTREAWRRLGVTWDSLQVGRNADLWSPTHDLGEKGWARVEELLDEVYADFKAKVAEGRRLDPERVEALAKGRVWTGMRAREAGLVDAVGGRATALAEVRTALGLAADAPLRLAPFHPRRRGPLAQLRTEERSERWLACAATVLGALDPALAGALEEAWAPRGDLRMPPVWLG